MLENFKKCPECGSSINNKLQTICYECGYYLVAESFKIYWDKQKELAEMRSKRYSLFGNPAPLKEYLKYQKESRKKVQSKLETRKRFLGKKKRENNITSAEDFELENIDKQIALVNPFTQLYNDLGGDKFMKKAAKEIEKESGFLGVLGSLISSSMEEEQTEEQEHIEPPKPQKTEFEKAVEATQSRIEIEIQEIDGRIKKRQHFYKKCDEMMKDLMARGKSREEAEEFVEQIERDLIEKGLL